MADDGQLAFGMNRGGLPHDDPIRSALEAARGVRLLLATPEIADAHPADKDEETHVAERKAARPSPRSMRLLRPSMRRKAEPIPIGEPK